MPGPGFVRPCLLLPSFDIYNNMNHEGPTFESMNKTENTHGMISRREALKVASCGFGYLALAGLSAGSAIQGAGFRNPLGPKKPHFRNRAKRVIFMFMQGGPSHLDTFDYRPELKRFAEKLDQGKKGGLFPSPFEFRPQGQSGLMISELFPHLARHADELCILNGMNTNSPAHPQATVMVHTGSTNFVRPSMGAWITYGLGSLNQDLPGFITINPTPNLGGAQNYGSSFLPAAYQGSRMGVGNDAMRNIVNSQFTRDEQRRQVDLLQSMNRNLIRKVRRNSEVEGIIESYELAYRMQTAVPGVMDLSKESDGVRKAYGIDRKETNNFGTQCLMARRLAESGVRFIQVTHRGWDQHRNLKQRLETNCSATDLPISALIGDLKQRGLLDETLLVWGGEFGRSPQGQNGDGRRHNNRGYTMWMAGGGIRGGMNYGSTDDLGGTAVEDKMHIHDLHATILHLMGLDHERLTHRYAGRDFRLTDVAGQVAHRIIS